MALAAMDGEPVAYISKSDFDAGYPHILARRDFNKACTMPVYAAQPAPVVPDAYVRDERGRMMLNGVCEPKIGFGIGWNACRAAMLDRQLVDHVDEESLTSINPAPAMGSLSKTGEVLHTNSPAQGGNSSVIPDTWIPVSERMPEVGDIVLTAMGGAVNVGEMECSAANCRFFTSVISGRELPATHWMPLPAGPKEDINALIPLVSRNEQEGK